MSDNSFNLDRIAQVLENNDKVNKTKSLNQLLSFLELCDSNQIENIFDRLNNVLNKCISDSSEICRELSIKAILSILRNLESDNGQYLINLIPLLYRRMQYETVMFETSEEVRLQILKLVSYLISKHRRGVSPFVEELVYIVNRGLLDDSPDLKIESSNCASILAEFVAIEFCAHSVNLIKPLISCFSHQRWKVRIASVKATGNCIKYGDNKQLPEVTNALAKRLFDDVWNVRLAVTEVIGDWLINLPDRYSFFPYMLPIILTSLGDSSVDVKISAENCWENAGNKYLKENENDYKDEMDFLPVKLDHYPIGVKRPCLGCRILVNREGGKFLPALSLEILDWSESVRIKSAQLLVYVILHFENKVIEKLPKILFAMFKAVLDPLITHNVRQAALYMGYFVPPDVYMRLIVNDVTGNAGELFIIGNLIAGSRSEDLKLHLVEIGDLIFKISSTKEQDQVALNELIHSLLNVCGEDCSCIGDEIFSSIVTNLSLTQNDIVVQQAYKSLNKMCEIFNCHSSDICQRFGKRIFEKLDIRTPWTVHCHQQYLFCALCTFSGGYMISEYYNDVINCLIFAISNQSDPEVVVRVLMTFGNSMLSNNLIWLEASNCSMIIDSLLNNDILIRRLIWEPGFSAEAVRSAGAFFLKNLISLHSDKVPVKKLLPIILSLIEDDSRNTREFTINIVQLLAPYFPEEFHTEIIPKVLRRLDDVDPVVRFKSVQALNDLYKHVKEITNYSILEFVFSTLLIHLDDQDEEMRTEVLSSLEAIAHYNPEKLRDMIRIDLFRDKEICGKLIKIVDHLITEKNILENSLKNIKLEDS